MISIIICSMTPDRFRAACAMYARLLAGVEHEVIGIHDAAGMCEGYNRGMRQARVRIGHDGGIEPRPPQQVVHGEAPGFEDGQGEAHAASGAPGHRYARRLASFVSHFGRFGQGSARP